ncbi:MAG: hypothetical protein JXB26_04050 [Candidatus Aminicenantes bacterium]|nr:hypothetical protein [Candidatus Aminicenantes bacterium]
MRYGSSLARQLILAAAVFLFVGRVMLIPCTVAVVSGKATADGRPLLWKNRDTNTIPNKLVYVQGEKYAFIGLVDAWDKNVMSIWSGINSAGFAIMNSASGDLADGETGMMNNGTFMRLAIGTCASVEDFERLLQETAGKRRVGSNFGVIDAHGRACFFETGADFYVKFDADDPRVAPRGYIVRTNYAFTSSQKNGGGGYIRFDRISHLFQAADAEGRLNVSFILKEAARDLVNEKLHSYPLSHPGTKDTTFSLYINTNDTINRNTSVAVSVFHGAPSPDKAYLSTMWVLLGQPVCTAAVPVWVHAEAVPEICGGEGESPLNILARDVAAYLYPDRRSHMAQYLNVTRLVNYKGSGILPYLLDVENKVLKETGSKLESWAKMRPDSEEVRAFQEKTAGFVYDRLCEFFLDIK